MKLHLVRRGRLLLVAIAGCGTPPVEYYAPEQVTLEHVSVDAAGHVTVDFRTLAETLYHCPGIDYERDGETLYLAFARHGVHRDDGSVMRAATPIGDRLRVEVDAAGIAAINVSDDATSEVVWQRAASLR